MSNEQWKKKISHRGAETRRKKEEGKKNLPRRNSEYHGEHGDDPFLFPP